MAMIQYYGTGRRKTATARAFLRPSKALKAAKASEGSEGQGSGAMTINGISLDDYFPRETSRMLVRGPLVEASVPLDRFNMIITVKGGGETGQAGAVCHAIARALVKYDESLKKVLRSKGFITRDSRMKERKKVGKPGARASKQFSKR
ncbi:MAG: 30S ribosomal protein S9 [Gammaproteobacteria bacterium]|nr:30S ribosomal protein S9 [Gammaproteobacteria bacterium]